MKTRIRCLTTASLLLACCCLNIQTLFAQSLYRFEDLSRLAYARQKDSLLKTWICPSIYPSRNTQKKYKELWDGRTEFITKAISNQRYVQEPEIASYVQSIVTELVKSNALLAGKSPLLLIDRSAAVNAYAVGRNLLAVNLGLIAFVQSREELALVLAHELSHNLLDHPDRSMREQAEFFTSAEYEQSLKDVLNSKYERFSKLKKLFEGYGMSNSRHHRYHENDADSLAIVLLKNAGIGFDARFFLRLDSADAVYQTPLAKPVGTYFSAYGLALENTWLTKRSRGLSTRNYNFQDSTALDDSLKTHPDCSQRFAATKNFSTPHLQQTPLPAGLQAKANKMLIWNLFDGMNLTAALYRIFQQKDKGVADPWYDFMVSNILGGLSHAENTLRRFNAIGIVPKEQVCKSYYELQTALEQMPAASLRTFYAHMNGQLFWQQLSSDALGLHSFLSDLVSATDASNAQKRLAQRFVEANKNSMYCEFASHFTE